MNWVQILIWGRAAFQSRVMGLTVPGEKLLRASLRANFLGCSGGGARKGRRDCKVLCLWNLNSCDDKVDTKCWLAEMMSVMKSLPLARVFQCLFTLMHLFPLCADWQKSDSSVDGEPQGNWRWNSNSTDVVASSPSFSCPAAKSTPESSLAGCSEQGWKTNLRIQTLAFYVGKRRVLSPSHCTTLKLPAPFYPHIFSHWTMIFPWPPAPSSSFIWVFCNGSVLYFGTSTCQ